METDDPLTPRERLAALPCRRDSTLPSDAVVADDIPSSTFTVSLSGDVDIACKAELTRLVEDFAGSDATDAELDVAGVDFMDSTGLAALVRLNMIAEQRHGVVRVVGPNRPVSKVLALSGVAQLVQVVS